MAEIQNLIIGMMLFSAIILGMGIFYTSVNTAYDVDAGDLRSSQNFERVFNKTKSIEQQVENTQPVGLLEIVGAFFFSSINAAFLLFDLPNIFASILGDMALLIPGMPVWASDIFAGIIAIIILFSGVFLVITKVRL